MERRGTWHGKRVEGAEIDWRLGWTGSRLMTQLRTLIGYEPKASLGGEREEAEGSERDEGDDVNRGGTGLCGEVD